MSKKFALIRRGPFIPSQPGEDPVNNGYPSLDVRRQGATADGVADDKGAIQRTIDYAESLGGGDVILQPLHKIASGLEIGNHAVRLIYPGGASRSTAIAAGGRIIYTGGTGAAIKLAGGSSGIQGAGLAGFRLENQGTGTIGVHCFNISNSMFDGVHCREFTADNWLLECDTNSSSIYNSFRSISGFKANGTAYGLRMVEGAAKAVNNNLFLDSHFGNNLIGIKQDSECHDNIFAVLELGSCDIGAQIQGRITLLAANIENCTTYGLDLVSGSSYAVHGSIHFGGNGADVHNVDGRGLFCSMQGGGAQNPVGFNATNTGMGFRGRVPPATGGTNYSTADGDPVIQRVEVEHIKFLLGRMAMNVPFRLKSYTVATLPAGSQGDTAFVTDALGPVFLVAVAGGGAVVTPVFYNGTQWVVA